MSDQLKPCPFCGRKRIIVEPLGSFGRISEDPILSYWIVKCRCEAQVVTEGKAKAIKIWNKRNKHDALVGACKMGLELVRTQIEAVREFYELHGTARKPECEKAIDNIIKHIEAALEGESE